MKKFFASMMLLTGLMVLPMQAQNQNYSQYEGVAPVVYITENVYEQPDIIAIFNNTHSGYFRDPKASRFVLVDQKGRWGLGIGGYVQTKAEYDFGGIVDITWIVVTDLFDETAITWIAAISGDDTV